MGPHRIGRRKSVLKMYGHTEIQLQELPQPMTKEDAVKLLQGLGCTATLPKGSKKVKEEVVVAPPVKTPEEIKAEAEAAKREQRNARKRELRALAKAKKQAEALVEVANTVIDAPAAEVVA